MAPETTKHNEAHHDVIVIGGSYSGMAAALQLVRARKKVLIIDAGLRRNRFAHESHGFLTQDGVDPAEIVRIARRQLEAYPTLTWREGTATSVSGKADAFAVTTNDNANLTTRRILFATGVSDTLPAIEGLQERWGQHVFHCPYCHGYELGGAPVGVIAVTPMSMHQAILLTEWGKVTFFLNNAFAPSAEEHTHLVQRGVTVETTPIARIGGAAAVHLADGRVISPSGLFTAPVCAPATPLAESLGCEIETTPFGTQVKTTSLKETTIPGAFACGDAAHVPHSISLAVGDGAMAGASVHRSLVF